MESLRWITGPRRERSAALLVGSMPGTLTKVRGQARSSAGCGRSGRGSGCAWIRRAAAQSERSSASTGSISRLRRSRSPCSPKACQAENSRLVSSSPAWPKAFCSASPSEWRVKVPP